VVVLSVSVVYVCLCACMSVCQDNEYHWCSHCDGDTHSAIDLVEDEMWTSSGQKAALLANVITTSHYWLLGVC